MKSCLYGILSVSCVLALLSSDVLAADGYNNFLPSGGMNSMGFDQDGGRSNSSRTGNNRSTVEDPQEEDYYPYIKSSSRIRDDKVINVRLSRNKLVLMSEDNQYSEENFDSKQLVQMDFKFFSKYPNLVSVDLTGLELSEVVLKNLQMYIPKTIKSLVVRSCEIEKQKFLDFTQLILNNKQLESITIIDPNCAVGETAEIIAAVSNLSNIKYLNLTLGEMEASGCKMLKEAIKKSAETLVELNLGFIEVKAGEDYNDLLASLGSLTKLRKLEYSIFESDTKQVGILFTSLGKLRNLTNLKICVDDFSRHDGVASFQNAQILGQSIKQLKNLENLDISNMDLPDTVLQVISGEIKNLEKLKTLNVSGNPINEATAVAFAEALKGLDNLIVLIANNCEITDKTFPSLCTGLQGSHLKHLYLSGNKIESSVTSLPVSLMKDLTVLNLSYNGIKMKDVAGFWNKLNGNVNLEIINWEGNAFASESDDDKVGLRNQVSIWKKEHNIDTIDLGI